MPEASWSSRSFSLWSCSGRLERAGQSTAHLPSTLPDFIGGTFAMGSRWRWGPSECLRSLEAKEERFEWGNLRSARGPNDEAIHSQWTVTGLWESTRISRRAECSLRYALVASNVIGRRCLRIVDAVHYTTDTKPLRYIYIYPLVIWQFAVKVQHAGHVFFLIWLDVLMFRKIFHWHSAYDELIFT